MLHAKLTLAKKLMMVIQLLDGPQIVALSVKGKIRQRLEQ